ncbi:energy-coupling factor transport system permease protein [Desulfonispora thiosulfatigenes DSM 11270]|uniref:Energy-coupling factor transport system permease protein n=1 Tax=Desulfonispora thiosulfatigenes DSM 11270 TaxID=656914 RepID=A0A1W1UP82_DESTI|nr:energy-coupling factor transporter transmembrane component T [Desulfonispora thiosulfatigenes]SMB82935.1 energy-coupling factor transport system permease protein [Desulfonispora thiosulfatigenes DSM 11270]
MQGFSNRHPLVIFAYYLFLIIFAILLFHPVYLSIALCSSFIFNLIVTDKTSLFKSGKFYLNMAIAVFLINPILNHRGATILFYLFNNPITLEATIYGLIMSLSLLTILMIFHSLQKVLDHHKFLYLFGKLIPTTAFLIMMTIRFVPLLKRRLEEITLVQKTKGVDTSVGTLKKKARDGMQLLNVLVNWSLEEALQTADSMKARGYGLTQRTSYLVYKMKKRDIGLLVFILILSLVTMYGWFQGYSSLNIYPELQRISFNILDMFFYGVFLLLSFIPVIEEGKEALVWQLWKLKT